MIRIAPETSRWLRAGLALLLAAGLGPLAAQEAAQLRRATDLRERPEAASRALATLPAESAVTRLPGRQGPWVQVRTAQGQAGWVHLFDLGGPQSGGTAGGTASGALRSVTSLFSREGPATTATSASGIRGLEAEDLARAQPDARAVAGMEALRQSEAQARDYARSVAWQPVAVAPLLPPPRPSPPGPTDPGNPQAQ